MIDLGFRFIAPNAFEVAGVRIDVNLRMPAAYVTATAKSRGTYGILSFDAAINASG